MSERILITVPNSAGTEAGGRASCSVIVKAVLAMTTHPPALPHSRPAMTQGVRTAQTRKPGRITIHPTQIHNPQSNMLEEPHTAPLFSHEEHALSPHANQPHRDPEKLYQHATVAREHLLDIVDRGAGISAKMGLHVAENNHDLGTGRGAVSVPGLKGRERSDEKVKKDYGGDYSKLNDIARASVVLNQHHDIHEAIHHMRQSGATLARRPKDRFREPTDVGYRDALTHWKMPNGHIAEVQFHVRPMMEAKAKGHKHYETVRSIHAKMEDEGRTTYTPEEAGHVEHAERAQRRIYGAAWKKSLAHSPMIKALGRRLAAKIRKRGTRYYDWNHAPAYRKPMGVMHVLRDGKWTPNYSAKYLHEAHPVTKERFEKLIKEHKG